MMDREHCNSADTNRLNKLLKLFGPVDPPQLEELLQPLCVVVASIRSASKASTLYKQKVDRLSWYANGYAAGCGRETILIGGTFISRVTGMNLKGGATVDLPTEKKLILFLVHSLDEFMVELSKLAVVASVQNS